MAATSSYQTYLMYKKTEAGQWEKLVDIIDYPDLKGTPDMLDATTLSDPEQVQIEGIRQGESKPFLANYSKEDYENINALAGQTLDYALWFGADAATPPVPDGHLGKFACKGTISVTPKGTGPNSVRQMGLTLAVSTPFELDSTSP